jgi:4-hydroxy-tetrahydrodipicolinate synthase
MSMKPQELKDRTRGVIHLVMTHFDEQGELDLKALRRSVSHAAGALKGEEAAFLVTGSTAEFYAMTDQENEQVIRTVVEEVNGAFPVIAGAGRPGTKWAIKASQRAQELGADGVMIVNPFYHLVTKEGLYRHHKEVAESIDIGIMIYNNPVTSKIWVTPDLMARLSKIDNIVLDKENTANVVAYYWTQKAVSPKDMKIITGVGQLFYPFESMVGSPGYVTELANFAPQLATDLHKAAMARDAGRLVSLLDTIAMYHEFITQVAQRRGALPTVLSPAVSIDELPFYQSVCKAAMSLVGLPGGPARGPMENITAEEKEELKVVLRRMKVL